MGVASCRRGGAGRPKAGCPSLEPFTTGRALGDGGIERPSAGLRGPRPPGTGARRSGTGDAMLGWGLEVPSAEKPGSICSYRGRRGLLCDDGSANPRLDAAGVTAVRMPAVRGAQRTASQPNALDRGRVQDSSVGGGVLWFHADGSSRTVRCREPRNADRRLRLAGLAGRGGLRDGGGRAVVEDDSRAGQ
jgi:hypothetical protein